MPPPRIRDTLIVQLFLRGTCDHRIFHFLFTHVHLSIPACLEMWTGNAAHSDSSQFATHAASSFPSPPSSHSPLLHNHPRVDARHQYWFPRICSQWHMSGSRGATVTSKFPPDPDPDSSSLIPRPVCPQRTPAHCRPGGGCEHWEKTNVWLHGRLSVIWELLLGSVPHRFLPQASVEVDRLKVSEQLL